MNAKTVVIILFKLDIRNLEIFNDKIRAKLQC